MTEKRLRQIAYEQGFDRSTMGGGRCGIHISTLSKLLAGKDEQLRPERIDRIAEYLEAVNTNEV